MSGFELLRGVRDLDATSDDYRPKKWQSDSHQNRTYTDSATSTYEQPIIGRHVEGNNIDRFGMNRLPATISPSPTGGANLRRHHDEPDHSRLDKIAKAIRSLTYGEMLELAQSMWKVNSRGSEITESDLPGMLHRWSASQR